MDGSEEHRECNKAKARRGDSSAVTYIITSDDQQSANPRVKAGRTTDLRQINLYMYYLFRDE